VSETSATARLWAPWRMPYIEKAAAAAGRRPKTSSRARAKGGSRGRGRSACLFCRVREAGDDRADLVIVRRPHAFLMLNRYPYNSGHVMIAVARHTARIGTLTAAERLDVLDLTALAEQALAAEYQPHGVNYGANVGRVAGAGFPGHFHLHLVPRWNGDTNFMPAVADTKVLPESLQRTWTRLRRAARALAAPRTKRVRRR